MKMYCGKFKGMELEDIPIDYLEWFARTANVYKTHLKAFVKVLGDNLPEKLKNRVESKEVEKIKVG